MVGQQNMALAGPGPPGSMTPALEISQPPPPPPKLSQPPPPPENFLVLPSKFLNTPPSRKFLNPPSKISQPNSKKSQSQKIC